MREWSVLLEHCGEGDCRIPQDDGTMETVTTPGVEEVIQYWERCWTEAVVLREPWKGRS
jgi:hypothetical protein